MSCWSNEESLSFLEHYQMEPCIWNPKDANHKDKKKQADAWIRLAELTGRPVKEIKNKKEILMTTFRKHLKKKRESMRSGADQTEDDPLIRVSTPSRPPSRSPSRPPSIQAVTNKRRRPASETAEKQMAVAFGQLTNVLGQRQNENIPAHKDDDCDLYAKLLAIKLRELSTDERKIMMYQIDGLFINRISQKSNERHTPYPQYYSRPSSMAGAYSTPSPQVIPSRPTSVNSVYSEPIHNNQRGGRPDIPPPGPLQGQVEVLLGPTLDGLDNPFDSDILFSDQELIKSNALTEVINEKKIVHRHHHQTRSRRKALIIQGIAEAAGEDCTDVTLGVINTKLGLNYTKSLIKVCHRLGQANTNHHRPILVRFASIDARMSVWRAKTGFRGSKVAVREFLTKTRQSVFVTARQHFGMQSCWTQEGAIFIKASDGSRHRVTSLDELNPLLSKYPKAQDPSVGRPESAGEKLKGTKK
ncbi:hypothetical protein HW555_010015 [Spodoptera exigua]|uniref:MADF domain-containing protein n=1 Tax=Spodoptera exigua TaxID=7107 RepID=A0A835GAU8_SPOEX|nr:hypothetical protein HW555_010015 [Spodoptera exigua]